MSLAAMWPCSLPGASSRACVPSTTITIPPSTSIRNGRISGAGRVAKTGDVLTFIQELERVNFREALELLARRAGITLEKTADSPQNRGRALMLDVVRWAVDQFHHCLLDSPLAEAARHYLGERKLAGETVRRFALGFAPAVGRLAGAAGGGGGVVRRGAWNRSASSDGERKARALRPFRDRVMFPIRDVRGHAGGVRRADHARLSLSGAGAQVL